MSLKSKAAVVVVPAAAEPAEASERLTLLDATHPSGRPAVPHRARRVGSLARLGVTTGREVTGWMRFGTAS